ncbi:hypothetical protein PINS_up023509 [Pythium insidiosum]|nr:hypothetical protein PINS_up023509 [Pythium insidiosum]
MLNRAKWVGWLPNRSECWCGQAPSLSRLFFSKRAKVMLPVDGSVNCGRCCGHHWQRVRRHSHSRRSVPSGSLPDLRSPRQIRLPPLPKTGPTTSPPQFRR